MPLQSRFQVSNHLKKVRNYSEQKRNINTKYVKNRCENSLLFHAKKIFFLNLYKALFPLLLIEKLSLKKKKKISPNETMNGLSPLKHSGS